MMKIDSNKISSHPAKQALMRTVCSALALMLMMACGGSGGGDMMAGGGIGGTGISIGEISGFGSIIVNDVDFDTKKAQVVVNGRPVGSGDVIVRDVLSLGMIVKVEGKFRGPNSGSAERIVYRENVKGPVTSIEAVDSIAKNIVVLGQNVIVGRETRYKGTSFDDISIGDVLQVSGWSDGGGLIRATFAAKSERIDEELAVQGIVTDLNVPKETFHLNNLSVDFSEAVLAGFPDTIPSEGQLVTVRGYLDVNGIFIAAEIILEGDLGTEDADDVEIEGVVTKLLSANKFVLGAVNVTSDSATDFLGIKPNEVISGSRLLVKGSLTGGLLLADEIIAKERVSIHGQAAEINSARGEIRLGGLDPLVIRTGNFTKIFGDADTLDDIQLGKQVKILCYFIGNSQCEAIQVKVEKKARDNVKLQGPITSIDLPIIDVIDVPVDTDDIPDKGFHRGDDDEDDEDDDDDDNDSSLSRIKFLDKIAIGDVVTVRGNLSGNEILWKEIEVSDAD